MKVLWISQNLPYPPKTGVLQRNYNLIREASAFADVHLVAIVKQDILPTFDEQVAARELGKLCASVTSVHLPIERSKALFLWVLFKSLFTKLPFTANWALAPVLRQAIEKAAANGPYDMVFFDTISLAPYRGLVNGSPTALNHHNIESHLLERRVDYEKSALRRFYLGLESRKLRDYEAAVAGTFNTNLVVSRLDGERLQGICPSASTAVLANGVDVDYFRRQSPLSAVERGHLIMVSGMNWFPNRDAVLHMAEAVWPELSRAHARRPADDCRRQPAADDPGSRRPRHTRDRHGVRRRCPAVHGAGAGVSVPDARRRGHATEDSRRARHGRADRGDPNGARRHRRRRREGRAGRQRPVGIHPADRARGQRPRALDRASYQRSIVCRAPLRLAGHPPRNGRRRSGGKAHTRHGHV